MASTEQNVMTLMRTIQKQRTLCLKWNELVHFNRYEQHDGDGESGRMFEFHVLKKLVGVFIHLNFLLC